jgi:ketosteroid isomerase-like protein
VSAGRENCERIERLYEAFERRAVTDELLAEIFAEDVEFNPLAHRSAGGRTYRGRDGVGAFFSELQGELRDISYESPEFHPLRDAVVAFTQLCGTERETGLPVRQDLALVYEFSGGQVRCVTAYETPAEALEAAERGHAGA